MANKLDDDDLEDDTWDDLPPEAFDALEQDALQSTQQRTVTLRPAEPAQTYHTLPTIPSTSVRSAREHLQQQQQQQIPGYGNGIAEDDFSEAEEPMANPEGSMGTQLRRPATYDQPGHGDAGVEGAANSQGTKIRKTEPAMEMDHPGQDITAAYGEAPIQDPTVTNLQVQIQQVRM